LALIATSIPARLDRLPWTAFHTLVVTALGVTWLLDGLEVTLAGSITGALQDSPRLHLTVPQIGESASAYLIGNIVGALAFGWLTDRLGRKRLFTITLALYLTATAATALSWSFASYALFRGLTGAGIGGEATAMNSAIQELIPARFRGHTDLAINGTFWIGAAVGAAASIVLLAPGRLPPDVGWRAAFGIGAVLGLIVIMLRRYVPESPRWLIVHGRVEEAEQVIDEVEGRVHHRHRHLLDTPVAELRLRERTHASLGEIARTVIRRYPQRTVLGIVLIATQAFFYNAIFFTYALVLRKFYGVPAPHVGWYLLPFAAGNFLGPLVLGRLFDTVGRRPMIAITYALSGALLTLAAILFVHGVFDATTQTVAWSVIFFFASAAASSAYLTISETFPLEIRAVVIALFYATGTLLGGVAAPWLFGHLIASGQRTDVMWGYLLGAALMVGAACVELGIGIAAERRPLEQVAAPLSIAD
jgi:MFS family permease